MLAAVKLPRARVWTYRTPAIVLGCSQGALRSAMQARLPAGLAVLERGAGGGAVLTGPWMVGVSVVLPLQHPWAGDGLLASYRHLGQLHAEVLERLGVNTRAVLPAEVRGANERLGSMVDWACFGSLAPWELADSDGRKLTGLAQRRQKSGVLLVAGTLVARPDWALLCQSMDRPEDTEALSRRTVSCEAIAGQPVHAHALGAALQQGLERELDLDGAALASNPAGPVGW